HELIDSLTDHRRIRAALPYAALAAPLGGEWRLFWSGLSRIAHQKKCPMRAPIIMPPHTQGALSSCLRFYSQNLSHMVIDPCPQVIVAHRLASALRPGLTKALAELDRSSASTESTQLRHPGGYRPCFDLLKHINGLGSVVDTPSYSRAQSVDLLQHCPGL